MRITELKKIASEIKNIYILDRLNLQMTMQEERINKHNQ